MVVSGSSSVSGLRRETTMLALVMAYSSFGRFRRASTRFDTPPCSGRHHPVSAIARLYHWRCARTGVHGVRRAPGSGKPSPGGGAALTCRIDYANQLTFHGTILAFLPKP